ncbi:unnamed protein product [Ilex paraguariensis]|uniref:Myb-like domain-containing protein n=1 Tax=Ilex paraguariensis TaxID=185542 RepID=A0ABC8RYF5_9AQUA
MVQKRPFSGEEVFEVSSKHPRHVEHSSQLVSVLDFPSEDVVLKPHTSGGDEDGFEKTKTAIDEKHASGNVVGLPICAENDVENSVPCCLSNSSWGTSGTTEENIRPEAPFPLLLSLDYPNHDCPFRSFVHFEEVYSYLLEHPPQKLVPIGPDYQADIPEWGEQGTINTSNCSDKSKALVHFPKTSESDLVDHTDAVDKLSGTYGIPMAEGEPSASNGGKVGGGRNGCCCEDMGSVRCVRQHIKEAREQLRRTLGQERFVELGLCDMGEVVAEKWSKEDERLFHEVVFSHPASLGKNFWDHLLIEFPFRTKKEIVSYYFNVFLLRRRAEQNGCDPMNIDSDDDEWLVNNDSVDDGVGVTEEHENSVVESPGYQDYHTRHDTHKDDLHEYDEAVALAPSDIHEDVDFGQNVDIPIISETCLRNLQNSCRSDLTIHPLDIILGSGSESGHHDDQDDSCTSFDDGAAGQVAQEKVENGKHWTGTLSAMTSGGGQEFASEPFDTKVWDLGYLTSPKNDAEFLPTCSMIEEVFGAGGWNCNDRDGKDLS